MTGGVLYLLSRPTAPKCPAHSHLSGGKCLCDAGYVAQGNLCVAPTPIPPPIPTAPPPPPPAPAPTPPLGATGTACVLLGAWWEDFNTLGRINSYGPPAGIAVSWTQARQGPDGWWYRITTTGGVPGDWAIRGDFLRPGPTCSRQGRVLPGAWWVDFNTEGPINVSGPPPGIVVSWTEWKPVSAGGVAGAGVWYRIAQNSGAPGAWAIRGDFLANP